MSRPDAPARPVQVPHGATSRRLSWHLLPAWLRREIEQRLGSPVARADSAGAGFTPGFASTLTGNDGRRTFVKAANRRAQRAFADAYALEIRRLRALPAGLPVPRLLWSYQDDDWVVLALDHVDGGNPGRPWRREQLDACLDTLEALADALTPSPMALPSFGDDFAEFVTGWEHVRRVEPDRPHLDEAADLAAGFAAVTAGDTLVHTDARDDNFLLPGSAGRAVLCDWNWPSLGAPWIDTISLLISAHGDGLDADAIVGQRRLTRDVDPESVDVLLALFAGFFLERKDAPAPNSSPYLRVHQGWYADATWHWLADRRGWSI